jgi:hypothetical protein
VVLRRSLDLGTIAAVGRPSHRARSEFRCWRITSSAPTLPAPRRGPGSRPPSRPRPRRAPSWTVPHRPQQTPDRDCAAYRGRATPGGAEPLPADCGGPGTGRSVASAGRHGARRRARAEVVVRKGDTLCDQPGIGPPGARRSTAWIRRPPGGWPTPPDRALGLGPTSSTHSTARGVDARLPLDGAASAQWGSGRPGRRATSRPRGTCDRKGRAATMNCADGSERRQRRGITRRTWLRGAAATTGAATVSGLPDILARAQAPAYPRARGSTFSVALPGCRRLFPSDAEFAKQAACDPGRADQPERHPGACHGGRPVQIGPTSSSRQPRPPYRPLAT